MRLRGPIVTPGRVVTPTGVIEDGDGPHRRATGSRPSGRGPAGAGPDAAWILPGFVDLHVHGGGGHTFTDR